MADIKQVYAKSLMEISEEDNTSLDLFEELLLVKGCFDENTDIYKLLGAPILSKSQKEDVLNNIFKDKVSATLINFLKVLTYNGKINYFSDIVECYRGIYNDKNGILDFLVTTAKPLTELQIDKLKSNLSNSTGKVIKLETHIDEKIVGGVILKVKNNQIDASVKNKLNKISELICNKSI